MIPAFECFIFRFLRHLYKGVKPGDVHLAKYTDARRHVDELTRRVPVSPAYPDGIHVFGGNVGLIHAFGTVDARLLPPNVDVLLSGHVHLWEQLSFASDHAAQFVSGFAGTVEDTGSLLASAPLSAGRRRRHHALAAERFRFHDDGAYGSDRWTVTVHDRERQPHDVCSVQGRHMRLGPPAVAGRGTE